VFELYAEVSDLDPCSYKLTWSANPWRWTTFATAVCII